MEKEQQRKLKTIVQVEKDSNRVIQLLNDHDTEINLVGGTPLNHAVNYDRIDIVKYLIGRGANVNALYDDSPSLLSAIENENEEMIDLLLENGADVNLQDGYGNDALFKAVFTRNLNIVKRIVNNGANPFVGNNPENYSSYDSAKDLEDEEIVDYFDSIRNKY
ncbi:ankyrin repeat domain-containing protein [Fluviicola sp.]|uniref:ankyrin repeat domain-containing protein n=1 Tax=Fluviicola sp. TaxID=1917219 RepID=UPI003D29F51B